MGGKARERDASLREWGLCKAPTHPWDLQQHPGRGASSGKACEGPKPGWGTSTTCLTVAAVPWHTLRAQLLIFVFVPSLSFWIPSADRQLNQLNNRTPFFYASKCLRLYISLRKSFYSFPSFDRYYFNCH